MDQGGPEAGGETEPQCQDHHLGETPRSEPRCLCRESKWGGREGGGSCADPVRPGGR